jgi:predicted dehydrogenase
MINILVIGGGNIGSRHIQGYLKSKKKIKLTVIEPSKKSKKILIDRIFEINKNFKNFEIYNSLKHVVKKLSFDFVLISTNSDVRLSIIRDLVKNFKFKNIFLEKIAFPNYLEFKEALSLLDKKKNNSWVNLNRRSQHFYQKIKKKIRNEQVVYFEVNGSLNLASNMLHFLDLFNFLSKYSEIKSIRTSLENFKLQRKIFLKHSGSIFLQTRNGSFLHFNDNANKQDIVIKIVTKNYCFIINETKSIIEEVHKKKKKIYKIKNLLQSELSTTIIDRYSNSSNFEIKLPNLQNSLLSHLSLYKIIGLIYKNYKLNKNILIT